MLRPRALAMLLFCGWYVDEVLAGSMQHPRKHVTSRGSWSSVWSPCSLIGHHQCRLRPAGQTPLHPNAVARARVEAHRQARAVAAAAAALPTRTGDNPPSSPRTPQPHHHRPGPATGSAQSARPVSSPPSRHATSATRRGPAATARLRPPPELEVGHRSRVQRQPRPAALATTSIR